MGGWDLCGGRQMLQAVRRKGPRPVIPEDLSDPSLLGAGEHGGRYRSRTASRGPVAGTFSTAVKLFAGRWLDRVHDTCSAVAGHPDAATLHAAVQLAAAPVRLFAHPGGVLLVSSP
jgi:hypothetical protein